MIGSWFVAVVLLTRCLADDTWYRLGVDGGETAPGVLVQMEHMPDGQLRYVGVNSVLAQVVFTGSVGQTTHGYAYSVVGVALGRNGWPLEESRVDTLITNPVKPLRPYAYAVTTQAIMRLDPGDTVEVYLRNVWTDARSDPGAVFVVGHAQLTVHAVAGGAGW